MKKDSIPIQYWDSCLFIALLTGRELEHVKIIRELYEQAQKGTIQIVASNFVLAEVWPGKKATTRDAQIVDELLESHDSPVQFYGVTPHIAREARKIGAAFSSITVPDAIHLATAITAQADVFLTYDGSGNKDKKRNRSKGLLKYDGKIQPYGLAIKEPKIDNGPLFDNVQPAKQNKGKSED